QSDASVAIWTQPLPKVPVNTEGMQALTTTQAEAVDLKARLQVAEQKIANLEKLCKEHEKSSQKQAKEVSKLMEANKMNSHKVATLSTQVMEQDFILDCYKEC
ncbi:hypothetical protein GGH92_009026, partial [Coemansia sp. RSA 2673]